MVKAACKFSKLMMEGEVRAALRLLTKRMESGPLGLNEITEDDPGKTVRKTLEKKHPEANPGQPEAILNDNLTHDDFHPVLFDSITAKVIQNSALHTEGAAGPSGVNAMSWKWLCTVFGQNVMFVANYVTTIIWF